MLFPWPKVGEFCGCEGGLINTIEMTKKISTQRPLPAASNKVSFSYYEPRSNRRADSLKHHLLHPSERGINIFKSKFFSICIFITAQRVQKRSTIRKPVNTKKRVPLRKSSKNCGSTYHDVLAREYTPDYTYGEFVCGFSDKSMKIEANRSRCCRVIFICAVYKLFNMFAGFQT